MYGKLASRARWNGDHKMAIGPVTPGANHLSAIKTRTDTTSPGAPDVSANCSRIDTRLTIPPPIDYHPRPLLLSAGIRTPAPLIGPEFDAAARCIVKTADMTMESEKAGRGHLQQKGSTSNGTILVILTRPGVGTPQLRTRAELYSLLGTFSNDLRLNTGTPAREFQTA
ncbi:hypothetical protein BD779DRAFT_1473230 [Infundibulicybe gibba]|nr:hypothetical protein BD779DRAFT_1473230 [Infundibulicybe gibba]